MSIASMPGRGQENGDGAAGTAPRRATGPA